MGKLTQEQKSRINGFMKGLNTLTEKYGLCITGCGCCGSPAVEDTELKDGEYKVERDLSTDKKICLDMIKWQAKT